VVHLVGNHDQIHLHETAIADVDGKALFHGSSGHHLKQVSCAGCRFRSGTELIQLRISVQASVA